MIKLKQLQQQTYNLNRKTENRMHSHIFTLSLIIILTHTTFSACTRERCCLTASCTNTYCTQRNSETWISTQSFSNYGYTKLVLSNDSCLPCAYNCQTCPSETTCSACALGFYMSSGSCSICSYACSSCVVTNSISKCSSCATGTYLNSATASCSNCPTGAASCSSSAVIASCLTGYYLTSNSMFCLACPSNCQSCPSSNTVCASCSAGYYLNASACYPCTISKCLTCLFVSSKQTCTGCSSSFYLKNGSCTSCPSFCNTCTNSTNCTTCAQGYYLVNGGCLLPTTAINNCNIYASASTCSNCVSSYYLSSAKCSSCSILCSACYGIHFGTCTACQSTASLFNQMCLPTNYLSNSIYQMYYSFPSASTLLNAGSPDCNHYLYAGTTISLNLNNLAASIVRLQWRVYSISGSSTYSLTLINSAGNQTNTFSTSSTSTETLCSSNTTILYSPSIQNLNLTNIKVNNTLSFTTNNQVTLALQQILIQVQMCNSLCVECTPTSCSQCLTTDLYTQDAYCVYTCSSGYYIFLNTTNQYNPKQCVQSCPVGSYALTTNLSCATCISPCLSCLNQAFCLSCVVSYFLTSENTCNLICPYRYFGQTLTQTCQQCSGKCRQCLDQQRCLNCNSGFFYATNYSCLDSCDSSLGITGMYADLNTLTCQPCSSSCLNCAMQSTYCTSCQSSLFYYNYTCLGSCPTGYYPNSNRNCESCIYPCENCAGNPSTCTSCVDRYLYGSSCITDCPTGYFSNNIGLVCTVCSVGCSQCVGSSSYCTDCLAGYYLFNNTCSGNCPSQYYGNSTSHICLACQGFCYTCTSDINCLSCNSNFLWNSTCIDSSLCPAGYYADIATLQCLICSNTCLTCQFNYNQCTSCPNNGSAVYLFSGTCLSNCSSVYYYASQVSGQYICASCASPCLTCTNGSYCLSCVAGYMLSNGLCSTSCSVSFYFNTTLIACSSCSNSCLICNSNSFCQLCANNYYIDQLSSNINQCVSNCPATTYANYISSSCQACIYPCANCSSQIDCLSCQEGALYQNRCLSSCPDTTFLNNTAAICSPCGGNCLTCSMNPTYCLTCQSSYFLLTNNDTCIPVCPNGTYAENVTQMCLQCPSNCQTCLNSTYCLSCIPARTFLYLPTNNCINDCPQGYYGNTATLICSICNSQCLTCSANASNCLSCTSGYYLVALSVSQFNCQTSCPSGYYQQMQNCYECIFPCRTCTSAASCITCVTGTYFYAKTSSCLLSCPSNSFVDADSQQCKACTAPCSSCKSSTYCLSCTSNLYLLAGICISSCPSQYYSDNTLICTQCYGLCKTCSSKYYCLSCLTGYLNNGFCYSSCPPGTYANLNASSCISCSLPCLECYFTSTYCTQCASGQVQYQGNCSSSCPTGTYQKDFTCLDCSFPCINCTSSDTCSECLGGYLLYNGLTCINDTNYCPNDFFKMDGKYCIPQQQCPSNYYIDKDLYTCASTCSQTKYLDADNKICVYSCQSYQYVGIGMVCYNFSAVAPTSLMGMTPLAFIKSSIVNIVVQFNQSVIWQGTSTKMYSLTAATARLLSANTLAYNIDGSDPTTLILRVTSMPMQISINLPAYNLISSITNYPLQTPNSTVAIPNFMAYEYTSIYQAQTTRQFGQGLSGFILLLSVFYIFKNRVSYLYILWDTVQILFLLLFLQMQYPPALNQFLFGLSSTMFLTFPNLFTTTPQRTVSDLSFYAYSYDNNFLRNAGPSITWLIAVVGLYLVLKICELLIKKVQKITQLMQTLPRVKKFIYEMLLRYRWHYISDIVFLTYLSVCLFAVAQIYHISKNPQRIFSNFVCVVALISYLIFPVLVGFKLHKHFPNICKGKHSQNLRCFYRGIDKTSQFGVLLIVIRYFRKIIYALVVGIFSSNPMYALPILMFTSFLMALFIFVNLPYKKRLSNVVEILNQICITLLFLLLALVNFNNQNGSREFNIVIGYICTGMLIFILLMLVFEIFCRTLFQLDPQNRLQKQLPKEKEDMSDQELRRKAGEFFDYMFPRIRQQFGFDADSEDEDHQYEEGDSQDSENNDERCKQWGIQSSDEHSEQFRHYNSESESEQPTEPKLKAPQFLVRCVKELS